MSVLSSNTEMLLFPLLYGENSEQELMDAIESLLGTPIRYTPRGKLEKSVCSKTYPQEDLTSIISFYSHSDGWEATREKMVLSIEHFKDENPKIILDRATGYRKILGAVGVNNINLGYIAIPELHINLDDLDIEQIKVVTRCIGLYIIVHSYSIPKENDENILDELLDGNILYKSRYKILQNISDRYHSRKYFRLFCFKVSEKSTYSLLNIKEGIEIVFKESYVSICDNNIVVLVCRNEYLLTDEDLNSVKRILREKVCTCCIGPGFTDIFECNKWYECMINLPNFKKLENGKLIEFDRHRIYSLMTAAMEKGENITGYICDEVRAMIDYDEIHKTKYYATLCAFFRCDRNYDLTAADLKVHVNTVQYRLKRIHELFRVRLDKSDAIFSVMLSIKATKLLNSWVQPSIVEDR